jgi:hypothetical protein
MFKAKRISLLYATCCVLVVTLISIVEVNGQSRQRINGTVVRIGGRLAGRTSPFTLIVNSYTAPNQVRELNEALERGGQDELLRALSRLDAGRIQMGNSVGVSANAIIATPWSEGGTKLTVFYPRNLSFSELRYGTRSSDYRIGYAEIFLDRNGKGEGTLMPAARVRLRDGNTWEVEDFGVFPARLMGLRASGSVPIR